MKILTDPSPSKYGNGVTIELTSDELAVAITTYLHAHNVHIQGPRTVRINGKACRHADADVFVDPSGNVFAHGEKYSGCIGKES